MRGKGIGGSRGTGNIADPQVPVIVDIVCALWMHNARKGQHQAQAMKVGRTRRKKKN